MTCARKLELEIICFPPESKLAGRAHAVLLNIFMIKSLDVGYLAPYFFYEFWFIISVIRGLQMILCYSSPHSSCRLALIVEEMKRLELQRNVLFYCILFAKSGDPEKPVVDESGEKDVDTSQADPDPQTSVSVEPPVPQVT